ncbi:MAG: EAL domain-containing protein [Lachnospiraceae bacterium]
MKKNKKSITSFIIIVSAILILLLSLGVGFIRQAQKVLYTEKVNYLGEISAKNADNIKERITGNLLDVKAIASFIGSYDDLDIEHELSVLEIENEKNDFKRMGIVSLDGIANTTDGERFYVGDRKYFQKAMEGKTVVSDCLVDKTDHEEINVFATTLYQEGKVKGVVFVTKTQEEFSDMARIDSFGGEGYSYLITSEGKPVAKTKHPNSVGEYTNLFTTLKEKGMGEKQVEKLKHDIQRGVDGSIENTSKEFKRQYCYNKIGIKDWYIVSVVPTKVISFQSDRMVLKLTVLMIFVIMLTISVSLLMILNYRKTNRSLENLAYIDDVTGYSKWAKFAIDVEEILKKNLTQKFAMIILDIEKFKIINDIYGHSTGNEVLKNLAEILHEQLEANETFGRASSDNFNVLMQYKSDENIVERLKGIISQIENMIDGYKIELAIGICQINERDIHINALSDRANVAKNIVKKNKDTFFHFFEEEDRLEIIREKEIENRMEQALTNCEFEVYLQPKYLLKTEEIVGAEALVRWNRGEEGMIFPNDFIPIFEKNGFIKTLDLYMFEQVCKLIIKWQQTYKGSWNIPISVNISRIHLSDFNLSEKLIEIADRYQVPRNLLEIELTESAVYLNVNNMIQIMKKIKQAGFLVSIDDFGSGYSSLSTLKDLPADYVKLDKSFLDQAVDDMRGEEIIQQIIVMIKGVGLITVAEGVETKKQIVFLKSAGCDIVQGYFYSKPIPVQEFEKLLEQDK